MKTKTEQRDRRKDRIRGRVHGTSSRPRLTVFRSLKHIYAQVIDDDAGCTLAQVGTLSPGVREGIKDGKKVDAARKVGEAVAKVCLAQGITQVVFDRNGYKYQVNNRIASLADGARKAGLGF